jgi:apolipoprotein D and lipocalin family protein
MPTTAPHKVQTVDLTKYSGKWYVIACIPTQFDKEWNYITETYTLNKNGRVDIETNYFEEGKTTQSTMNSKGFPDKESKNVKWKVQFVWPFKSDYQIEEIASDYSYAVVGHPEKKFLYIMNRSGRMTEEKYIELLTVCGKKGYDLTKLRKVPQ